MYAMLAKHDSMNGVSLISFHHPFYSKSLCHLSQLMDHQFPVSIHFTLTIFLNSMIINSSLSIHFYLYHLSHLIDHQLFPFPSILI